MTLKTDAKIEEKPTCCFKNDKNVVKFDPSTWKSPKLALSFAPIVQSIWPKKVQKSYLLWY